MSNQELHNLLKSHYTLEESGISRVLLPELEEDRRAHAILKKTSRWIGDRFKTGLLRKEDNAECSDSCSMAVRWPMCLEKHLRMDPDLYANIRSIIANYLVKDYACEVTASELLALKYGKVWYTPLNIVYKP